MYKSAPMSNRSKGRIKLASSGSNGIIESFSTIWNAPLGFEDNIPYTLALIRLENDKKVFSEIVDSKNIKIGAKVEPCLRRVYSDGGAGLIHYGTKFRVIK